MYTQRIQITNYGPISNLDITFPFESSSPIPVVFVGPNGSGKSILLSHIVNPLLAVQGRVFPESAEVSSGKVFKLRSSLYIRGELPFSFSRVDFSDGFYFSELRTRLNKGDYTEKPSGLPSSPAESLWQKLEPAKNDQIATNIYDTGERNDTLTKLFRSHCALYFPPDRFEAPAWLNESNLESEARHLTPSLMVGQTTRRLIASSPLHDNRDWLFDVVYDRAAFEVQTSNVNLDLKSGVQPRVPIFMGYSGEASTAYEAALTLVRTITERPNARFGIGGRRSRTVSLFDGNKILTPNIFQLSSGEVSLLNLGLSILRDFDLCGTPFSSFEDIRGIVVIDEVDLHLHVTHQYDILPNLLKLFPSVQFVITTHSPLVLLGMQKVFGDDGFTIYELPTGKAILPEAFSEFEGAYNSLSSTRKFQEILEDRIKEAQKPILFPEGETDKRYIETAARLLERTDALGHFDVWEGGGKGSLRKLWDSFTGSVAEALPQDVVLMFDCDAKREPKEKGRIIQRTIPYREENPVAKGIENLFGEATLKRARSANNACIDVDSEHTAMKRGQLEDIPETWTVNPDEKTNLCEWLCENGTAADFQGFGVVFDLLDEVLPLTESHT